MQVNPLMRRGTDSVTHNRALDRRKCIWIMEGMKKKTSKRSEQPKLDHIKIQRPRRLVLSREEVLQRMKDFPKRREQFIAAIRAGKS
jgi:hypothetical protein